MNVLLTNHEMLMPGGSETYCFTMAEELKRLGHNPIIYTPKPGTYAALVQQTIPVQPLAHKLKKINFNLAILHQQTTWNAVKDLRCYKIWNSNSPYRIEMPVEPINRHVAISEEIACSARQHGFNTTIVRNGINCQVFKPRTPINKKLQNVLMITNHFPGVTITVKEACKALKVKFRRIGQPEWTFNQEAYINNADLVISLGRGIYEAMACARNAIVFDINGGDGIVTPDTLTNMKWFNCSGRLKQEKWNTERLIEEMLKYNPQLGPELREIALKEYNIQNVIKGHLDAYHEHKHQYNNVPAELLQEVTQCYH